MDSFGLFAEFIEDLSKTNTITNFNPTNPVRHFDGLINSHSSSTYKPEQISRTIKPARPMHGRMSTFQHQHHPSTAPSTANNNLSYLSPSPSTAQTWTDPIAFGQEPSHFDFSHNFAPQTHYDGVPRQQPAFPHDILYSESNIYFEDGHTNPWNAYQTYPHAAPHLRRLRHTNYPHYPPTHQAQLDQISPEPLLPAVGTLLQTQCRDPLCHCPYFQAPPHYIDPAVPMLAKQTWAANGLAFNDDDHAQRY